MILYVVLRFTVAVWRSSQRSFGTARSKIIEVSEVESVYLLREVKS